MKEAVSQQNDKRAVAQTVLTKLLSPKMMKKWLSFVATLLVGGAAYAVHLELTTTVSHTENQNVSNGGAIGQSTAGTCSPNIVGTGNLVNCPPQTPESYPAKDRKPSHRPQPPSDKTGTLLQPHGAIFDHVSGIGGKTALLNCSDNVTFKNSQFVGNVNGIINDPNGVGPCRQDRDLYGDTLARVARDAGSSSLIKADFDALRERLKTSISGGSEKQQNSRAMSLDEMEEAFVAVGDNRAAVLGLLKRLELTDISKD
jgi:hypothetical protein